MAQPSWSGDSGQERASTDSGLTGDKVAVSDPAAAPVHTDAEAASAPTLASQVAASVQRLQQTARAIRPKATMAPFASGHQPFGGHHGLGLVVGALVTLVAAGIVAGLVSVSGL